MRSKALLATALFMLSLTASAQDFPSRPITMIVPVPPGGAVDVTARALADQMSKSLGQPVVVENRTGASGMLGAQTLARAVPDGYTILVTHGAPILNAPFVFSKVPYDPARDFAFVTQIASSDLLLVVNKDVPAHNMKEFMAWAEGSRGKLSYGSFGAGGVGHLMSAYLNESRKLDMTHVAYRGEAPLATDILAGNVPWGLTTLAAVAPHMSSGRVRALAVMGRNRFKELPQVPTMAEAGFPDSEFQAVGWLGLMAPAATPAPVLARLEKDARAAIDSPALRARFQLFGFQGIGSSSKDFRQTFDKSVPVIEKLVRISGVKAQ